jgi:hypothetical protein
MIDRVKPDKKHIKCKKYFTLESNVLLENTQNCKEIVLLNDSFGSDPIISVPNKIYIEKKTKKIKKTRKKANPFLNEHKKHVKIKKPSQKLLRSKSNYSSNKSLVIEYPHEK